MAGRILRGANERTVIVGVVFSLLFLWNFSSGADPDFWWHLKAGETIAQTHTIPRVDTWTYTIAGQPWSDHEWLAELAIYLLYTYLGFGAVTAFFSAITASTYVVLYALLRRQAVNGSVSLVLSVVGALINAGAKPPRPLAFTLLFVALFAFLLAEYQHGHRRALWLLPPVMLLWANLHAGFTAGFLLLGCYVLGSWLNQRINGSTSPMRPLLGVAALCLSAVLLTPLGLDAILYPLSKVGDNATMQMITEWQSPDFHDWPFWPLLLAILVLLVLGTPKRVDWSSTLTLVVFVAMALYSVRHISLFGIIAMTPLAARLKGYGVGLREQPATYASPWFVPASVVTCAIATASIFSLSPSFFSPGLVAERSILSYPTGAVAYLRDTHPPGRLLNSYDYGGYLIYQLPEYPVFIDGRGDPFPTGLADDYFRAQNAKSGWLDVLDRYGINIALMKKDDRLVAGLDTRSEWRLAYEGTEERLYLRIQPIGY